MYIATGFIKSNPEDEWLKFALNVSSPDYNFINESLKTNGFKYFIYTFTKIKEG